MGVDRTVVLDVGHGNATIVQGNGTTVVIDAGLGASLLEYLLQQGISKIDVLILSHADEDHIAGLNAVLASSSVAVSEVKLNADGTKDTRVWDDLAWELDQLARTSPLNYSTGICDTHPPITMGNTVVEIVGPTAYLAAKGVGGTDRQGRRIRSNSLSVVARVSVGAAPRVLAAGDLDRVGLDELIAKNPGKLPAETLVFPHHGGRTGSNDRKFAYDLTRAVAPRRVLFSLGRYGAAQNPTPEIVQGVRDGQASVHIMCTQLSQRCFPNDPSSLTDAHLADIHSAGRGSSACCAGSVVISHGSIRCRTKPSMSGHSGFVSLLPATALCRK